MDPVFGPLASYDEETGGYVLNTEYRPVPFCPYPFVASLLSPLAPTSELVPSSTIIPPERRKAASFLDLDGNLRKWPQAREVPSLRKADGPKAEGFAPALSVAYKPPSWLSEQDWFDGEDAPTDNVVSTDTYRPKGDRSARRGFLAEGSRSVHPGTKSAPLEERYKEQVNYKGDRSAPRGAESGSLVEGCRSTSTGVESAALAEGSCSGCPGPQSAPLEERCNKGCRSASTGAESAALAGGSCSGSSGLPSAPFEERLQELEIYEGGRTAPKGRRAVYLAEGSCSGPMGTQSAPLEERVNKGDRGAPLGSQPVTLAEGSRRGSSDAQSAYLKERIKVAERLEVAAESRILRGMSSLKDVDVTDALARMYAMRTGSSTSVGRSSILKRSRTEEMQPEPPAKRVRWCPGNDALPTPTNTRGGMSQRLYSPRPPLRWDQRLVHGAAKLKAAFADVVVKNQSSYAM